jgi:gluconokinase
LAIGQNAVYACSALKESCRRLLKADGEDVKFVHLQGPPALIAARLANRKRHFFDPALLQSQFEDLEEPSGVMQIDISPPPNTIVDFIIGGLGILLGEY